MRAAIVKFLLAIARRVAKAAFDAAVAEAAVAGRDLYADRRRDLRASLDDRRRG